MNLRLVLSFAVVIALVGGSGWLLFGWETMDNPELGIIKAKRFFGRVTVLEGDTNRDGNINVRLIGYWPDPLDRTHAEWREEWEDRNHDGRWDTWLENGTDGVKYRVDTDADAIPDREFVSASPLEARQQIEERRGF